MRDANGDELPVLLKSADFARLMGWLKGNLRGKARKAALRKARRWLEKNRIGRVSGRDVEWTWIELLGQAPAVVDELIRREMVQP